MFQYFVLHFIRVIQWFFSIFIAKKPLPKIQTQTKAQPFEQILHFYKTTPDIEANKNIQEDLYVKDKRNALLADEYNPTEKTWSSRILMMHTKTGSNIIMYYNCFKMAFAYYSDSQMLSNEDLYYTAIKYVVQFRCRDFLIDMKHYPDNKMIDLLKEEDKQMQTKTRALSKPSIKNSEKPSTKPLSKHKKQSDYPYTTKFVRIGKLCDFNILNKPRDKHIQLVNKLMFSDKPLPTMDNFFDNLMIDEAETKSLFVTEEKPNSYAVWKKQQQQQHT